MRIKTRNIDIELTTSGLFAGIDVGRLSFEAFIDRTGQKLSTSNWTWSDGARRLQ